MKNLVDKIAAVGRDNPFDPPLQQIDIFRPFFSRGRLKAGELDARDGSCTRRELLARCLILCAVIDQGPDIVGVRDLLRRVTNSLYRQEIRFLHRPLDFFREINISVDGLLESHQAIKEIRAEEWAANQGSVATRYNLFMDNTKQVLNYAVFRWGVPLLLPYLLEKDAGERVTPSSFLDYIEGCDSAELMSRQIKDHERYGLGKAIGDKACHLFAKWLVRFGLIRRAGDAWGEFSFETPFDSNAGRVLWRAGYFLHWADLEEYEREDVVQRGQGNGGKHHIRVTNIRGMGASRNIGEALKTKYDEIAIRHLKVNKRSPRKVQIQRLQHALLLAGGGTPTQFDDGLIHIGTRYCFNKGNPRCGSCPIRSKCRGGSGDTRLISDYRT